ncbi:class I SAM-dependent methyltransferase [Brasilonema sp. UFV-L1]|uniref:class I SAM-dependent methyltransferase n=1 Tax=Brasilonema sp. UFV-L1 TaxID=2234130 RepID=UPI00145C9547|nr:class I SAM-dependent methyltransferase [Brasilonema sp. UFV-L1]NMG09561.1 SAM-dependent methyltransferase [Brasilonema sp. UFV-L1]
MAREKKINYYDNIAQIYDRTRWLTESVAEEVADFILKLVCATPETSFLEPGVGTGLNVLPFVKRGYSVTGIDISSEMLAQFRQKFNETPQNLKLIHADASHLPFLDNSFDVVLTVHMLHFVSDWRAFLDDINRVLKPGGFYLNCQWITPPARKEFEDYFRAILAKYEGGKQESKRINAIIQEIDVEEYFYGRGVKSNYFIAKEWTVKNTVRELLSFLKSRAYGLCWQVPDEMFNEIMNELEEFCIKHYGSLEEVLSSEAKFEIWAYRAV